MKKRLYTLCFMSAVYLAMLLPASLIFAADFALVANKDVPFNAVSKTDAKAIFLGNKTRWDDGKPIRIAILEGGGASRTFLERVINKTPSQFELHWKKLLFTGKAVSPKTFDDALNLLQFVAGTSGAVGFVGAEEAESSVKKISIKQESSK
ncbi:MAG: hypothetical protein PHN84_13420 [Desulfuromonadaceae bacterium]|nr:hypothetical protein [Desulfuromonadaceae bacterium]MDD2856725.1 hypothetical protein [Desulfuromonadaceae bacterium]